MRIGSISLAAAGAFAACTGWAQTVDPGICASCHREIAENYARTGMGRSFRSVRAGTTLPEFDSGSFDHPASGQRFTTTRREGDYFLRRRETGSDGKDVNALEVRVDYVIGSGDHSRSYLHRTPDNRLVELPASWYAENGGHWGISPGYDRPGHPGFSREISYRCMFCHNGYPEIGGQAAEWSSGTDFPARLPEGIDCQRCHGPGGNHVDAAKRGRPRPAVRAAIVNPARLNPERRLEVCMQCHLETTSAALPGALMKKGRGVFSYRPGEPLENYILYFDYPPRAGHEDKVEIVSAAYRFRKSACFEASGAQFSCTRCHDPHRASSRAEILQKTQVVCQGCHAAAVAKLIRDGRHSAAVDCASCHMPQRRAADAIHIAVTDHKISRRPAPEPREAVEEYEGRTLPYLGEVKLYYPARLAPTRENELYLAIAQVNQLSNLPDGLRRLEQLIIQSKPEWARAYFEMGEAFLKTGQPGRALPLFREAARREPQEWRYLYEVAQLTGAFDRALAIAPGNATILNALGSAKSELEFSAAFAAFRQILDRDPENALAHNNLGNALLRNGDAAGAGAALRQAVRLRPELASIRINLGAALMDARKPGDGKFEFEEAIRTGPSVDLARSAWFEALAGNRGVETAKTWYERSLDRQLAGAHAMLGTALVSLGDREKAISEYRLALAADPGSAATLVNLALTLAARGDRAEARQHLEQALRISPDLFAAHLKLGEILLSEGQPGPAADHLKRAAESPDERIRRAAQELLSRL